MEQIAIAIGGWAATTDEIKKATRSLLLTRWVVGLNQEINIASKESSSRENPLHGSEQSLSDVPIL